MFGDDSRYKKGNSDDTKPFAAGISLPKHTLKAYVHSYVQNDIQYHGSLRGACFSGVMLTIGMTLGRYWQSLPPADFLSWFAKNNHFISAVIPTIFVPTFIGILGSLVIGWNDQNNRYLWIISILCILAVVALTFAYFVPTNTAFASSQIKLNSVPAKLNEWLIIHAARIILAMAASVLAFIAIIQSMRG